MEIRGFALVATSREAYIVSVIDMASTRMNRSRVAVLGLLADLHQEPIRYDLKLLRRLVKTIQPDLLCAEIHPDDWQAGDLSKAAPEYRDTLVPLSRRTGIVIVPVASSNERGHVVSQGGTLLGVRRFIVRRLNGLQRFLQRFAKGPGDVNSGIFDAICDGMCAVNIKVGGAETERAWDDANQAILGNVLETVRRDPGRRVLVTVDCRRRRWLMNYLSRVPEIELVDYRDL